MKNDIEAMKKKITSNAEEILEYQEEDGSNLLHYATENSQLDMIRLLIESGIKIDSQNKNGKSSLHIAVRGNMYDVVEQFIAYKADINIQNKDGFTPLFIAVQFNFYKIAELLLKNNANFQIFTQKLAPIHLAAANNNPSLVELLIHYGSDPNLISQEGKNAYHYTQSIFVQKILRSKMNSNNFPNYYKMDNIEIINEEISFLNSLIETQTYNFNETQIEKFFHLALTNRYPQLIQKILKILDLHNYKDKYDQSLLHYTVIENNNFLLKMILNNNGNPNIIGAKKQTPLHVAAEQGNLPAVIMLLKQGANYNAKDYKNRDPLNCSKSPATHFTLYSINKTYEIRRRQQSIKEILHIFISEMQPFIDSWIDINDLQIDRQIGKGINGISYLGKWNSKDVVIKNLS
ncbi:cyclin-dependent kinase inhibitor 2c [Anaeramoeba ignava]|uniref:Cyclin-dependent kinase inhibitor 2c n=1 Tax=Anaeramoeba ignava TaxID=1746090 RepID=A0A9Q0L918_ANAIG|nr:cyclin-dependent kinase inhibitor 2c [Anaeramoeba ignava]